METLEAQNDKQNKIYTRQDLPESSKMNTFHIFLESVVM